MDNRLAAIVARMWKLGFCSADIARIVKVPEPQIIRIVSRP